MTALEQYPIFDSHFHIIAKPFPLVANNGYLPPVFTCTEYLNRIKHYNLCGGAVVSASFQAYDQSYLLAALKQLGPGFVGVTQLPASVSDHEILRLNKAGIRAVRFNLHRGGSENISQLSSMASRIFELAGWHTELYLNSGELDTLYPTIVQLPSVSIDHLGLSHSGLDNLTRLVDKGVKVKASGFGRVDFDIKQTLQTLYSANPKALLFGTDLPSTRADRPYSDNDFLLLIDALGSKGAKKVLYANAAEFYRPEKKAF